MKTSNSKSAVAATISAFALASVGLAAIAAPFQLNAESQSFINNPPPMNNGTYPAPTMVSPMTGGAATYDQGQGVTLPGNVVQQGQNRPLQGGAQRSAVLPPQFMGTWAVSGRCTGMDGQPQFKAALGSLFAPQTQNTWTISGSAQGGYQMSNDQGVSTALNIWKATKNTAMIRYQHPISKTMAQEAIVMELQNGGATFQGLERISIVKEGEPQPRAKVTYQLFGQRQR